MIFFVSEIGSVELWNVITNANAYLIGAVILLSFLNVYMQFLKWNALCSKTLQIKDKKSIWLSLFYGFAGGAFTPARLGEFLGRKLVLKDHSLLEVSLTVAVDKLFNMWVILFPGVFASLLFMHYMMGVSSFISMSLLTIVSFLLIFNGYLIISGNFWNGFLYQSIKKIKFLHKYLDKLRVLKKLDNQTLTKVLIYSILFYGVFLTQYALLVIAFSAEWRFVDFLWSGSLMFFTKTLFPPITISEIGIREAASIYFLSFFGIADQIGFNAAFLLFGINVLLPALIGMILMFRRGK